MVFYLFAKVSKKEGQTKLSAKKKTPNKIVRRLKSSGENIISQSSSL